MYVVQLRAHLMIRLLWQLNLERVLACVRAWSGVILHHQQRGQALIGAFFIGQRRILGASSGGRVHVCNVILVERGFRVSGHVAAAGSEVCDFAMGPEEEKAVEQSGGP